jgi:hypothetical protein
VPRDRAHALGNMRANRVRPLAVSCHLCHHAAVLSADPWPDHVPVPTFGPHRCAAKLFGGVVAIVGADRAEGQAEIGPAAPASLRRFSGEGAIPARSGLGLISEATSGYCDRSAAANGVKRSPPLVRCLIRRIALAGSK